jgi:hypothetical protein
MNFKKKILLKQHKTHRHLWLTSIITLFIFATSISAYFLVKNSQDIRKSASEPYDNECTCIYNSTCSAVNMKPCEGQCNPTCNYPAICCGDYFENMCDQGNSYCIDGDTVAICKADLSGYVIKDCASNSICDSTLNACKTITATCEGTCYTNSSCSAIGKVDASGTCLYSTSVCCKEPTTSTCEGTCYTNSSCSAIGKVDADGSCLYSSSVCCKNALKTIGTNCNGNSECESGYCYAISDHYVSLSTGLPTSLSSSHNQAQCHASPPEGWEEIQAAEIKGTLIGVQVGLSFVPGLGPIIQIVSAATQGVQAVYTCSELAEIKNNPEIDQATKDQFSRACLTSSISAVTGAIGGGASAVGTVVGSSLSVGGQLALSGVGMIDNVGNVVVGGMNANNACQLYGSNSLQCYAALGNMGVAVGSAALSGYQFGQSYNNYALQLQTNQILNQLYDAQINLNSQLESAGVTTIINADRSVDSYFSQHPSIVGYYDSQTKTINLLSGYEDYAYTHELIHAIRDNQGANQAISSYLNTVDFRNPLSQQQMYTALEEVGTISRNLSIYDSIDDLSANPSTSYMYTGEQAYLQRNTELYLNALRNMDQPPSTILIPNQSTPNNYKKILTPSEYRDSLLNSRNSLYTLGGIPGGNIVIDSSGTTNWVTPRFLINP